VGCKTLTQLLSADNHASAAGAKQKNCLVNTLVIITTTKLAADTLPRELSSVCPIDRSADVHQFTSYSQFTGSNACWPLLLLLLLLLLMTVMPCQYT